MGRSADLANRRIFDYQPITHTQVFDKTPRNKVLRLEFRNLSFANKDRKGLPSPNSGTSTGISENRFLSILFCSENESECRTELFGADRTGIESHFGSSHLMRFIWAVRFITLIESRPYLLISNAYAAPCFEYHQFHKYLYRTGPFPSKCDQVRGSAQNML